MGHALPAAQLPTPCLALYSGADVKYSAMNIGGILLGLAGSVTYSAVSYLESRAASTAAAGSAKAGGAKAGGAKANKVRLPGSDASCPWVGWSCL